MDRWIIEKKFKKKPKLSSPVLIEGLPGVGHVGKIAVDFIVEKIKPILLYKIYSYEFPHQVYLTDKNFVELPSVNIYVHKAKSGRDIILVAGDYQPLNERSSYEFCDKILNFAQKLGCKEIITLGGIGLPSEVKKPIIFGAVTDSGIRKKYGKLTKGINFKATDRIEAIIGASGVLLGLAKLKGLNGTGLLAETYSHPTHFGFKEAKVLLAELKKVLDLKLDLKELDKELKNYEKAKALDSEETDLLKFKTQLEKPDLAYIG